MAAAPSPARGASDSEKSKEKAESRSIYWDFSDSRMAGRLPPPDMPSSALRAQHKGKTPPHTSPGRAALEGGVGKGGTLCWAGELGQEGRRAPSPLGSIPLPRDLVLPPRPWSGLADGLHATSRQERLGHAAPEPLVGGGGWRGHAVARAVQTEYLQCTDRSAGRGSLSPGTKGRGSTDGTAMPGAGSSQPGPSSSAWTAGGSGYSLARPMMVRMYRKMLMMSVYRFRAANTYSSGLRDSCLFPSSN